MELDWETISIPWLENEDLETILLDKVDMPDVMDKYDLDYTKSSGSDITHRARCPFPYHDGGEERTPSFFIYGNKRFRCYGCGLSGSVIDFVSLTEGMPNLEAASKLIKLFGIVDIEGVEIVKKLVRPPEQRVSTHVLGAGIKIRDLVASKIGKPEYKIYCDWADSQFIKLDKCLDLEDENWEKVKTFCEKIVNKK